MYCMCLLLSSALSVVLLILTRQVSPHLPPSQEIKCNGLKLNLVGWYLSTVDTCD